LYYSFYLLVLVVVVFCVYMCWCCVYTRIKIYIGNMHRKIGKDRACGSGDILADRQTHRRVHHNTSPPLPRAKYKPHSNVDRTASHFHVAKVYDLPSIITDYSSQASLYTVGHPTFPAVAVRNWNRLHQRVASTSLL